MFFACVDLKNWQIISKSNSMAKLKIEACLSSKSAEWATPREFFNKLDDEFHFNLDPCSTHLNAKCEKHYTIADDGLSQDWVGTEYFATLLMEGKSPSGLESATMRAGSRILSLSCSSLQGRIHHISTIISTGRRRKSDLSEADCISMTAKKGHHSLRWWWCFRYSRI